MEAYELSKLDTEEPSLVIYSLITLVCVYQSLGEYEKAIAYAEAALEDTIRYHGANRIDALYLHEVIGDLLARQGRFSEACERYTLALVMREKNLPADTAALARLEKKLTCAEEGKAHQIPEIIMWV
jgi:tetratricopeptide (TPR) repeat protein